MRGGISYSAKRHSKANNRYMKDYDSDKEKTFMMYLDANNLYVWTISQYLPYGNFKWMSEKEINKFDLASIKENSLGGIF